MFTVQNNNIALIRGDSGAFGITTSFMLRKGIA